MRLPTREDMRSMMSLAAPIAVMQTGLMLYGLVDTLFLGRVSADALAGVGVGSATFHVFFLFALGFLLGIDTLASRAYGAGKHAVCAAVLVHGAALAVLAAVPVIALLQFAPLLWRALGVRPSVIATAAEYLFIFRFMALPALLFTCCRQYLQSMDITRPLLFAIAAGNSVNAFLNWVFIFGNLGAPAMGVKGCAWASVGSSLGMLAVAAAVAYRQVRLAGFRFRGWHSGIFRELAALGLPSGLHLLVEVSVFALTTMLMARFGPVPTAAHHITMNLASLTFMVPLGVSLAAAVRVGQGIGRGDPKFSVRAGDSALIAGAGFMAVCGLVLFAVPGTLMRVFTAEPEVIALGSLLLRIAAFFQVFDGMQVILAGSLRGLGLPRLTLYVNVAGHAFLGLPLGYWLAFRAGVGPRGLWCGLLAGLGFVALVLYAVWRTKAAALVAGKLRADVPADA